MTSLFYQSILRSHRVIVTKQLNLTSNLCNIIRLKSGNKSGDDIPEKSRLGSSTILMQDGAYVTELPVIIRKVKDILEPFGNNPSSTDQLTKNISGDLEIHHYIAKEFSRCLTFDDIIILIGKCNSITPNIAVGALERILFLKDAGFAQESKDEIFLKTKSEIIENLFNLVLKSNDLNTVLSAMKVASQYDEALANRLCDEILERVTDNKLSIVQLCDVIHFLGELRTSEKLPDVIDKLWVGFTDREWEFTDENIVRCFRILPYLKKSQKMILNLLEKRLFSLWWKMKVHGIIDIMNVLADNGLSSNRACVTVGRWLNTNIHALNEDTLLEIVAKFTQMVYSDTQIEKAIERYVKAKGIKIKNHTLMVAIMNHCVMFRIRNEHILNGCVEYFIAHGKYLSPMFVKPLLFPLGFMAFHPNNGLRFWEQVEAVLQDKISKINTADVLDIMLACVYLEKYPLNFSNQVFNPHFLERINSSLNHQVLRNKLKLLDTAMTLECKAHNGPLLPKDHCSKSLWHEGRIKRIINNIKDSIETVAGDSACVSTSIILPHLFTTELYVVDIMLHPKGLGNSILNLNLKIDRNINVAVLINLPEHYCADGETLLGPQLMRIRHFRILGLKVVNLKYATLSRLKMHREQLEKYLREKFRLADPAF